MGKEIFGSEGNCGQIALHLCSLSSFWLGEFQNKVRVDAFKPAVGLE